MQPGDPEVLADVVAAFHAAPAVAAGGVRGAGDARADPPSEPIGAGTELDHVPAPLVAGDQRPVFGPEAGVVTLDDVRVGAADRGRPDPAQDLERSGHGTLH